MGPAAIPRHKTAIRRGDYSRPVKCLLRDSLLGPAVSLFDYGCGRGEDLALLAADGIPCAGWDPAYRTNAEVREADVVNLGYVINVIESLTERAATVQRAWALCRKLLVVSAQVSLSGRGKAPVAFGDGVLTTRGTFQKFFDQNELKAFLEASVRAEAIPADLGVFYLFKDAAVREQFLSNRYRRREILPRRRVSDVQFQENRDLLEAFMAATAQCGRLPEPDEFPRSNEVVDRFGSLKRAFSVVRRITGDRQWEQIAKRRTEDMLVYLALARLKERPAFSLFPVGLQRDTRAFFGTYARACEHADTVLFQAGKADLIDAACKSSMTGKLLPDALYVHRDSLAYLAPLLRVYEGCGRAFLGEIEGANLIKIHRYSGKVSYLLYPDFETDPHPPLARSFKVNMRTRQVECLEFGQGGNPPVLHRKESFLHAEHPLAGKFGKLTRQEAEAGLLDDTASIGTRDGWHARLAEKGYVLRGHRLCKASKNARVAE